MLAAAIHQPRQKGVGHRFRKHTSAGAIKLRHPETGNCGKTGDWGNWQFSGGGGSNARQSPASDSQGLKARLAVGQSGRDKSTRIIQGKRGGGGGPDPPPSKGGHPPPKHGHGQVETITGWGETQDVPSFDEIVCRYERRCARHKPSKWPKLPENA